MMKNIVVIIILAFVMVACKSANVNESGTFILKNNSNKVVEYVWLTPEGDTYQVAKSLSIAKGQIYEVKGLKDAKYDIAIDFKDEYNSFNSKKNKSLCLDIDSGTVTIWLVDENGVIIRD